MKPHIGETAESSRHVGMNEKQRAYWNHGMAQDVIRLGLPADAMPAAETLTASAPASIPAPAVAPAPANTIQPDACMRKADSFSGMSATFIVLGLLLVGGAIAPLLAYFQVVQAAKYFIGLAYIILVTVVVSWLVGKLFARTAKRSCYVLRTRIAVLAIAEVVLISFTAACYPFEFRWEATSLVLAATLLAVQIMPSRATRWNAYSALSANEVVVIFVLAIIMFTAPWAKVFSDGQVSMAATTCFTVVIAIIVALTALRVCELFAMRLGEGEGDSAGSDDAETGSASKRSFAQSHVQPLFHPKARNAALLVLRAVSVTVIFATFVYSFIPFGTSKFAFDIVIMGSALACTALGFKAEEPVLRRMGFAFAMLSIAKMVLFDTLMYGMLEKAVAYIVGGAVCFALGALYNFAVKRLA